MFVSVFFCLGPARSCPTTAWNCTFSSELSSSTSGRLSLSLFSSNATTSDHSASLSGHKCLQLDLLTGLLLLHIRGSVVLREGDRCPLRFWRPLIERCGRKLRVCRRVLRFHRFVSAFVVFSKDLGLPFPVETCSGRFGKVQRRQLARWRPLLLLLLLVLLRLLFCSPFRGCRLLSSR